MAKSSFSNKTLQPEDDWIDKYVQQLKDVIVIDSEDDEIDIISVSSEEEDSEEEHDTKDDAEISSTALPEFQQFTQMTQGTNEICVVQNCSNSCYEHFRQCYLHLKRAAQKLRAPQKKASLEQLEWLGSLETRNCCVVDTESSAVSLEFSRSRILSPSAGTTTTSR